ncbi:MAG: ABC transporter permease, partial [Selenomonadaceae bacterium]|nr:ABC transporter permease [Selenomonadaceae bacterium]
MPYEKVCLTVAMIISVVLSVLLAGNFAKDAPVIVVDLDNSKYSRELITQIDSSEYMSVKAVLNVPASVDELFYRDEADAVIYLPEGLEKNFYSGTSSPVGIFYDNSNTAQTADIKAAMNELIAINNAMNSAASGGLTLNDRNLFNPAGSTSNTQTLGFLFFFGSMFFVFATIGMVPRLRLTKQLDKILTDGTPWDLIGRVLPYSACMVVSFFFGLAILRIWGDLVFSGRVVDFLL